MAKKSGNWCCEFTATVRVVQAPWTTRSLSKLDRRVFPSLLLVILRALSGIRCMCVSVRSAYWTSSSVLKRYVALGVFLSPKSGRRYHTSASMERPYRFEQNALRADSENIDPFLRDQIVARLKHMCHV